MGTWATAGLHISNVTDRRVNVITIHSVQGQFVGLKCSNLMCEGRFWSVQHAEGKQTWGPWLGVRHTEVLKGALSWYGCRKNRVLIVRDTWRTSRVLKCKAGLMSFVRPVRSSEIQRKRAAARRRHSRGRYFLLRPAVEGQTVKTSAGGWRGRGVKILSSLTPDLHVCAPDGWTLSESWD